jgi:hypothetical protein
MNTQFEREFLKGVYPSTSWQKKVDAMDDDQVIAIYLRIKSSPPDDPEAEDNPDQGRLF